MTSVVEVQCQKYINKVQRLVTINMSTATRRLMGNRQAHADGACQPDISWDKQVSK